MIRTNRFKGSGGADYFPLSIGVLQILIFDFYSEEIKGKTVFKGETSYNKEIFGMYSIALTIMLITPVTNLFPAFQISGISYFFLCRAAAFFNRHLILVYQKIQTTMSQTV